MTVKECYENLRQMFSKDADISITHSFFASGYGPEAIGFRVSASIILHDTNIGGFKSFHGGGESVLDAHNDLLTNVARMRREIENRDAAMRELT